MNLDLIRKNIDDLEYKNNILYFKEIDSTNTYCKINSKNLNNKTIVIAEKQLSGRGKNNRKWFSPKGGLYFSILLKNNFSIQEISFFPLIVSLAVHNSLKEFNINTSIKWPNDILFNNKKLAGILLESKISKESLSTLVIGIGININSDLPSTEIEGKFISLKNSIEILPTNEKLLYNIINNFNTLTNNLNNNKILSILDQYKQNCILLNKKVLLTSNNLNKSVLVLDINEDGSLKVKDLNNNEILNIYSGEFSITGINEYI